MTAVQILGPGLGVAIREAIPGWLLPAFVAITHLGNVGFLLALFALDYWFGDRERGSHAIALAIGGVALVVALKFYFDVPRPPPEVNVINADGYSFPSGHAAGATIGYGILAYDVEVGPRWARYPVAAVLVALVALSRVVLGVHFVRDVVAGVLVGLAFLAVTIAVTRHEPGPGFLVAVVLAVVGVVVSGATQDSVVVLGAALGARLGWERVDSVPRVDAGRGRIALLVAVLPVLAGVGYLAIHPVVPRPVAFLLGLVLMAGVLLSPHLVARLERSGRPPPNEDVTPR